MGHTLAFSHSKVGAKCRKFEKSLHKYTQAYSSVHSMFLLKTFLMSYIEQKFYFILLGSGARISLHPTGHIESDMKPFV